MRPAKNGYVWFYCRGNKRLGCDNVKIKHIHASRCIFSEVVEALDELAAMGTNKDK